MGVKCMTYTRNKKLVEERDVKLIRKSHPTPNHQLYKVWACLSQKKKNTLQFHNSVIRLSWHYSLTKPSFTSIMHLFSYSHFFISDIPLLTQPISSSVFQTIVLNTLIIIHPVNMMTTPWSLVKKIRDMNMTK